MTTTKLKRLAAISYGLGRPPPKVDDGDVAVIRATNIERGRVVESGMLYVRLEDLPLSRAPLLSEGEILVVRSGAYTGDSALITARWAGAAPGYDLRIAPMPAVDPRFLAYQLVSTPVLEQIELARSRAAQPHLNAEELGEVEVHAPESHRQTQIADALDQETARIDALVHKKHALFDSLGESWVSRLWRVMTKGLDGRVEMKPSGLPWAGDMPAHWTTPPVYALFDVQLGKMLNPERASGEDQAPYLRNVNVQWDRLDLDDLGTMSFDAADRVRYSLEAGDLLVCEGGEVGRSAVWNGELDECFYQKAIHRVRPRGDASTRFLMYALWCAASMDVFSVEGNRATIVHLTAEKLREHRFPMPPRSEQDQIVAYLDAERRTLNVLGAKIEEQLELLAEHRQALITAAVTGQIDPPVV